MSHILDKSLVTWNLNYNDNGQLYAFDQTPYAIGDDAKLWNQGYVYIPDACKTKSCPTHIFFHGCSGTAKVLGTYAVRTTGHLEHGSASEYVTFFP